MSEYDFLIIFFYVFFGFCFGYLCGKLTDKKIRSIKKVRKKMNQSITIIDKFNITDKFLNKARLHAIQKNNPFIGLVRLYENGKILKDEFSDNDGNRFNLTIASGREFGAQALFKMSPGGSVIGSIYNYKIDHFGIGSGGSILNTNDTYTLAGPLLCDTKLYTPLLINGVCLDTPEGDVNVIKKITSAGPAGVVGSIEMQTSDSPEYSDCDADPVTENGPYYTVVKCTCVIDSQEPTNLLPGESVKVDEAMLYATSPIDDNPIPFAHICFAPKFVEKESVFTIEWYVIF